MRKISLTDRHVALLPFQALRRSGRHRYHETCNNFLPPLEKGTVLNLAEASFESFYIGKPNEESALLQKKEKTSLHRILTAVYLITPITLLLAAAAFFFPSLVDILGLSQHPRSSYFYMLAFNYPHIFASILILITPSYLFFFRRQLLIGSLLIIIYLYISYQFDLLLFHRIFLITLSLIHSIGQQSGIFFHFLRRRSKALLFWKWMSIAGISAMYILPGEYIYLGYGATILGSLFLYFGLSPSDERAGRLYGLGLQATLLGTVLFNSLGLVFLEIILLRFAHDVTAFTFYVNHNKNRLAHGKIRHTPFIIPIISAIALTLSAGVGANYFFMTRARNHFMILDGLVLMHYFFEHFAWKKNSPLRKQVAL